MQTENVLDIKEIILSKLIKLVQKPLLKYIDILLKILKIFVLKYQYSKKHSSLNKIIEQFNYTLTKIRNLVIDCSNINDINILYRKIIIFLDQFNSLNIKGFNLFQPLIVKFHYFHKFFQSFKVINYINGKFTNVSKWDVSLKKEIEWSIAFNEDLLNRINIESKDNEIIEYDNDVIGYELKLHYNLLNRKYKLKTS